MVGFMIYTLSKLQDFLFNINVENKIKYNKKYYYNIPMSFDIETSSFYVKDNIQYENDDILNSDKKIIAQKRAVMYIWQFAINDNVIYGRTWEDFLFFLGELKSYLKLNENNFIIVYVHNLSYEFQFFRKWLNIIDVFADSERKPIKVVTVDNMIFKCSYRLSGYSLATLAKNLKDNKYKKMVGDLDYRLIRNSKTQLSDKELGYCFNDVLIVTSYIREMIFEYGDIIKIPLTQTGKVRRYVRDCCLNNPNYSYIMRKLTIEKIEYSMLRKAFMGGFTHSNPMNTNQICENVTSFDFTSSYPTVMIAEKYPMGKGKRVFIDSLDKLLKLAKSCCFVIDIDFINIRPKFIYDNIISYSKCRNVINSKIQNGRVISADKLTLTITNIDLIDICDFYDFDKVNIGICYAYYTDYLPKDYIQVILKLYNDKTKLKGVVGKEIEYLHGKELLNSLYGMCVTNIVHDVINYDKDMWNVSNGDVEKDLENYNRDKNRFIFYPWGVWVTAYARHNLFTAIKEFKSDYIYSDTDSIKCFHAESHKEYIDKYNTEIILKLKKTLDFYGLDTDLLSPSTIDGVSKPLGIWDLEGTYAKFKTLGAKRYMTETNGVYSITVSGLSKKQGVDYIAKKDKPFDFFNDGMYIPREYCGKMTHTYIDDDIRGILIDYQGNSCEYYEKSFIHLENTDYSLSIPDLYLQYIKSLGGIK